MTIGAISPDFDNAVIGSAPAIQQPSAGAASSFAKALVSSLSSGTADLDAIFDSAAQKYGVPANVLKAVAKAESGFNPNVTSTAGAMGIMQLMPGTAKYLGVTDPFNPEQSILGGANYLRQMLDKFGGDLRLALAAYNAGPNNVVKYDGIPPFTETQNYVSKILGYLGDGDITAGMAPYGGLNAGADSGSGSGAAGKALGQSGASTLGDSISQMLLMRIIEMQMNSSDEDKDKKIF